MPLILPAVLTSDLKRLALPRTWSRFASGQIATSIGLFHSRKFSTGGFSTLEIFSFPLSIALSGNLLCMVDATAVFGSFGNQVVRYKVIEEVGNGTFGSVWRAQSKESGDVVAIKKMKKKYYSWEECISLREVKSLRKMNHPNIVKLKEVIRENDVLYFVFENMECDLYQLMKDRRIHFSEAKVRKWCFQVFQGLAYIHERGYFHRDLKPENLLVSKDIIKIADFGLAREINSQPPFTEYVSTRWYRAPEVLLQSPTYGPSVDMWAMGAIMAELFTLCPLFPGSSEVDQIYKICCVIGSPNHTGWAEGQELATAINYQFPQVAGVPLYELMPGVSVDAVNLIKSLCSWNPCKRPTALEVLQHPFFQSCFYVPPSLRNKTAIARTPSPDGRVGTLELNYGERCSGNLSTQRPPNDFRSGKPQAFMSAGVQKKLDSNKQGVNKNDKDLRPYVKQQPRYRPPGLRPNGNLVKTHGSYDEAEKMANKAVGNDRPMAKPSMPPPMKAGGWHQQSNLFFGRPQDIIPGRTYARKLAG